MLMCIWSYKDNGQYKVRSGYRLAKLKEVGHGDWVVHLWGYETSLVLAVESHCHGENYTLYLEVT